MPAILYIDNKNDRCHNEPRDLFRNFARTELTADRRAA